VPAEVVQNGLAFTTVSTVIFMDLSSTSWVCAFSRTGRINVDQLPLFITLRRARGPDVKVAFNFP
jgi:hypothetical protein